MDHESIRELCMSLPGSEESFPFDEHTLVFKVGGKMFLLLALDANPPEFNVKCHPDRIEELREKYSCVKPGFHMNKSHWNTITSDGTASEKKYREWIRQSYDLVLEGLPKKSKSRIKPG